MSTSTAGGFRLEREWAPIGTLLRDIWRSRPLFFTLSRQSFYVRYRRTSLGLLWAVGLPLLQALVLAFVFTRILRIGRVEHFPVFLLAGLNGWSFFSSSIQGASTSIVDGAGLSTRIYFPRLIFPLVTVGSNLYGYVLSLGVLVGLAVVSGVPIGLRVLWLIPGSLLLIALTAAVSVVLSVLHVYLRDIRYIIQAALFAWLYATPVIYSISQAKRLAHVLPFNPVTGVVLMLKASVVDRDRYFLPSVASTVVWTIGLALIGLALHRRYDRVCTDLL